MRLGLKYMGKGVFARAVDENAAAAEASAEGEGAGEASAQRARKKSVVEAQQDEDDKHIRFTIGGVGRRMTKEDFITEMKKHDRTTRREVVDKSDASHAVKTLAKQDTSPQTGDSPAQPGIPASVISPVASSRPRDAASQEDNDVSSEPRSRSISPGQPIAAETEVERGRRLAVLQGVSGHEDASETPAERWRREAALGPGADDDSDDDNTPRVPPFKKSIRFADVSDTREGP